MHNAKKSVFAKRFVTNLKIKDLVYNLNIKKYLYLKTRSYR